MICKFCGDEYNDGTAFCKQCGAKLPADGIPVNKNDNASTNVKSVVKTARSLNTSFLGVAIIIFIIAAIVITRPFNTGTAFNTYDSNALSIFYSEVEESYVAVSVDGAVVSLNIDNYENMCYSLDRSVIAYMAEYDYYDGGTLYYVTRNGKTQVSEGVFSYVISDDGSSIAYIINSKDYSGDLYLYNISNSSKTKVSADAYCDDYFSFVSLSPDGASIAYIGDYDDDSGDVKCYVSINGDSSDYLGTNIIPIAISKNGTYIYYCKYNDEYDSFDLYAKKKDESTKLASSISDWEICFNKDYSQALYIDGGKTYITIKAGEKIKISSSRYNGLFMTENSIYDSNYSYFGVTYTYSIDTFANKLMRIDDSIVYLDNNFDTNKIETSFYDTQISEDGSSLLYIDDSYELYLVEDVTKSTEGKLIVDDYEVVSIAASPDLRKIYFIDGDDALHYTNGNGESVEIADDVYPYCLYMSDNTAFFMTDYKNSSGTLYSSKNGRDKVPVHGADDIYTLFKNYMTICYKENVMDDYVYDLYMATSGTHFTLILESVTD